MLPDVYEVHQARRAVAKIQGQAAKHPLNIFELKNKAK